MVGTKVITVPKSYAVDASPVLKEAFSGRKRIYYFDKSQEKMVNLFVEYLFKRMSPSHEPDHSPNNAGDDYYVRLTQLYELATYFQIPDLRNLILKRIHFLFVLEKRFPKSCLNFVYENTPKGSGLRALLVFLYTSKENKIPKAFGPEFPQEFLGELAVMLLEKDKDKPSAVGALDQA